MDIKTDANGKSKRQRISIDLEKYPDVKSMLKKAKKKRPGVTTTHWVIQSLRLHLPGRGFGKAAT